MKKLLTIALCAVILSTSTVVAAREGEEAGVPVRAEASIRTQLRGPEDKPGMPLGGRLMSSTTRAEIKDIRVENREKVGDMRVDARVQMKGASSSQERKDIRSGLRKDIFKAHQARLTAQLTLALDNLKQIRARIAARIDKAEASGRTMTDAKALLVTADAKITLAAQQIDILASFTPPVATSTDTSAAADASVEVELEKPRQVAENAIKAVKDARKALVEVTIAVAKNMGIRCNTEGEALKCQATTDTTINATTTTP
ncbi:MAG: hypothetical protein AAB381_00675 [Patescibacteria group bacterium]